METALSDGPSVQRWCADDFRLLPDAATWLGQLGFDPPAMIRQRLTEMLSERVSRTEVDWVEITDRPRQFTAGRHDGDTTFTVTRVGIVIAMTLAVHSPGRRRQILRGVFTFVMTGMGEGQIPRQRTWLDLDSTLNQAERELKSRMFHR
ncbi:hypothetical protein OHB26_19805 [Nocardia sp. NBC_01503]|uniref:hypothetical protein n=1 Tax=Nocardia sp. NBC_01503 TaxID=2975997 RepID=UPI002E7ADC8B|nr:hypothetical protein [Nocardia sp. NBC_01503]WTL29262.1 hypothetical protein OHB26_19805 [Nocardia sp. NBC_01503]